MAQSISTHIFHLGDVVDVNILQEIVDCFCDATGLAAIIVDYQGKPITRYSNFHPFCQKLRAHHIGGGGCEKSDAYAGIEAVRTGQPYMYRCHMGLIDLSAPIIVEGQYLGAVMTGQLNIEDDSLERIAKPAINLSDYPELEQLYREIPSMSRSKFEAAGRLIFTIANFIAEKGMLNIIQNKINEQNLQLVQEMKAKQALESALSSAELQAIQAQINPHFVFNTLNTISRQAILEDAPKTQEMVYAMAELLRVSYKKIDRMVTLEEEIKYIQDYLLIKQIRLHDSIEVKMEIETDCMDLEIPIFSIQPLLENALIHGLEPKEDGGVVLISAAREGKRVRLEVRDNGLGMTAGTLEKIMLLQTKFSGENNITGIGISSVVKRLRYQHDDKFEWEIHSQPRQGTRVVLYIPYQTDEGWEISAQRIGSR